MKRNIKTFNRYFVAILYEEDKRFNDLMNFINTNYTEITYVDHDRDIEEDGTLKKKHRHVVFKVGENARSIKQIAEEMQYNIALIQGCNHEAMLLYLLHKNNPEKTQYTFEEVQGDKILLKKLLQRTKDKTKKYNEIINAINEGTIKSPLQLMYFATANEYIEEVKSMQFMLYKIIEEKWQKKN